IKFRYVGIILTDDQSGTGYDVGIRDIVFLLAIFANGDLIEDGIEPLRIQSGENAVPRRLDELGLYVKTLGNLLSQLHVKTCQLAVFVMERERRVRSLRSDPDFAVCLDCFKQVLLPRGCLRLGSCTNIAFTRRVICRIARAAIRSTAASGCKQDR